MPLPIRPLAVALTLALSGAALLGASGMAWASPGPAGAPPQDQQQAQAGEQQAPPQARRQQEGPRQPRRRPPRQDHRQEADPLSDSIRRIERTTRGQVLSAERVPYDGRAVSRIKVVDEQGRVRVYMDDPQAAATDPRTRGDDD
jgi:hypothetical protein